MTIFTSDQSTSILRPTPMSSLIFSTQLVPSNQNGIIASKVGMTSPAVCCPINDIDVSITDDGISDEAVNVFCDTNVVVMIAWPY
jgi:hypothetical protein